MFKVKEKEVLVVCTTIEFSTSCFSHKQWYVRLSLLIDPIVT